jgi:hypothetical protein
MVTGIGLGYDTNEQRKKISEENKENKEMIGGAPLPMLGVKIASISPLSILATKEKTRFNPTPKPNTRWVHPIPKN